MKAEVVRHPGRDPKNNPRFVITNLATLPRRSIKLPRAGRHGEPAQGTASRLEWTDELPPVPGEPVPRAADRGGVAPFQTLHPYAQGTACADAQVSTLRERLLKLAAWAERSVRRIVLHLHHVPVADDLAAHRRGGRPRAGLVPVPPSPVRPSGDVSLRDPCRISHGRIPPLARVLPSISSRRSILCPHQRGSRGHPGPCVSLHVRSRIKRARGTGKRPRRGLRSTPSSSGRRGNR